MLYSKITAKSGLLNPIKSIKRIMSEASDIKERLTNKTSPVMKNRLLYKELLEEFNQKTFTMQQKSKSLHNCIISLILNIDESVQETE